MREFFFTLNNSSLSVLHVKFTASVKKAHIRCGPCFSHFFIYISPTRDIYSISGSFEDLTTKQSNSSHSSQSASGSILLSLQANATSISNMSSINDSKIFFEILLATNITHSKYNETA